MPSGGMGADPQQRDSDRSSTAGQVSPPRPISEDSVPQVYFKGTIRDEWNEPLAGAKVILRYRLDWSGKNEIQETTTGENGDYQFVDLPFEFARLSAYSVLAYTPGKTIGQRSQYESAMQSRRVQAPITTNVSLGIPTHCVAKVIDEQGNPVSGVELEFMRSNGNLATDVMVGNDDWSRLGLPIPVSDDQGRLVVPAIDGTQRYDLRLSHPDFAKTTTWAAEFTSGTVDTMIEKGDPVRIVVGSESDPDLINQATIEIITTEEGGNSLLQYVVDPSGVVEVRLRNKHSTIRIMHPTLEGLPWYFYDAEERTMHFSLHRTGKARGRVLNKQTGQGAAGVSVQFVTDQKVIKHARTDDEGYYSCELAEHHYDVAVGSPGRLWKRSRDRVNLSISAGELTEVDDLAVEPNLQIKGKVISDSGEPIENAIVVDGFRGDPIFTDAEGRFQLLPPQRRWQPIQVFHPQLKLSRVVHLQADGLEHVVRLRPEGVLRGVLRDSGGQVLPRQPVELKGSVRDSGRSRLTAVFRRQLTDQDGFVDFVGLSEGLAYQIGVSGGGESNSLTSFERFSRSFQAPNLPRLPVEIEVPNEIAGSIHQEAKLHLANDRVISFRQPRWIGGRAMEVESFAGKYLLIAFGRSLSDFSQAEFANQMYRDHGLGVVGVLMSDEAKEQAVSAETQQLSFPIAIDDEMSIIFQRYKLPETYGAALYDSQGRFVEFYRRNDHLAVGVRNHMLYTQSQSD